MTTQKTTAELIAHNPCAKESVLCGEEKEALRNICQKLEIECERKTDRLAELEAALEFYADHSNWDHDVGYKTMADWPAVCDRGLRARKALQPTSSATQNSHSHSSETTVGPKEAE